MLTWENAGSWSRDFTVSKKSKAPGFIGQVQFFSACFSLALIIGPTIH